MSNKTCRWLFVLYLAIAGSYCGLEIDTFLGDTPFFRIGTLLLFCNVLCVMLVPPIVCALFASIRCVWTNRAFRGILLVLNALYFLCAIFLALYKWARKIDFDFYFLWYNTADALPATPTRDRCARPRRPCGGHAALSPNGRWIAYTSDDTGENQVLVQSFPDAARARWQITRDGGRFPRWRRDGRELYYVDLPAFIPGPQDLGPRGEQSKYEVLGARWPSAGR